jgi:gluconolactonase
MARSARPAEVIMNASFELVAKGIAGAEGPVLDRRGRLFCVEPPTGKVLEIRDDGTLREHANTGGVPAGLQTDSCDDIWVADMKRGILRIDRDGRVHDVVRDFDDRPIRGCNDLSFDSHGNLYFTAPAGSGDQARVGEVFCRLLGGEVIRIDAGFAFCNGIAVAAGDAMLIVAETFTKMLWAYDLLSPGHAHNKRPFAKLRGDHRGGPDGIDFDCEGNLLAANWGGSMIEVFDRNGEPLEQMRTPFDQPSNLHFGGADGRTLWVTEHTNNAVWKTTWRYRGLLTIAR